MLMVHVTNVTTGIDQRKQLYSVFPLDFICILLCTQGWPKAFSHKHTKCFDHIHSTISDPPSISVDFLIHLSQPPFYCHVYIFMSQWVVFWLLSGTWVRGPFTEAWTPFQCCMSETLSSYPSNHELHISHQGAGRPHGVLHTPQLDPGGHRLLQVLYRLQSF